MTIDLLKQEQEQRGTGNGLRPYWPGLYALSINLSLSTVA